jgi:CMP-N-acetylneuraminic acid synthetase
MRPAHLAEDDSSAVDVVLHALDWYETERGRVDGVLLLQPTSPFRSKTSVERGIAAFESHAHRTVLGVSPAESHPMHCLRLENGLLQPFIPSVNWRARTQDLPSAFVLNGAFYLITPDRLRSHRSFFSGELVPLLLTILPKRLISTRRRIGSWRLDWPSDRPCCDTTSDDSEGLRVVCCPRGSDSCGPPGSVNLE